MNTVRTRIGIIGLIFTVYALSACQDSPPTSVPADPEQPEDWQTYTNIKYKFSIQYPPGWRFRELPAFENTTQNEIWFSAEDFPPSNTDAHPDMKIVISEDDPLPQWGQEYFTDYRSEVILVGERTATRITGINKESLQRETVVILMLDSIYLQLLPSQNDRALDVFEEMLTTFEASV